MRNQSIIFPLLLREKLKTHGASPRSISILSTTCFDPTSFHLSPVLQRRRRRLKKKKKLKESQRERETIFGNQNSGMPSKSLSQSTSVRGGYWQMSLQTFYPKQTVGMLPSAAVSAVSFPVFLSHSLVLLVFTFHNLRLNVSILHNEKRKKKIPE